MKLLIFKDFMRKYNLKNDTTNDSQLQKIIIILYTLEIVKYTQKKASLISTRDRWEALNGLVL